MPRGPDRETAEEQVGFCGRCHRLPAMLPPGQIHPENPVLARFPSVGLIQSACFKASRGELGCTTCHDPHARVSRDESDYDRVCLSCHAAAPRRVCSEPSAPRSGCASCHMPRRDVGQDLRLTDHWIRPRAGAGPGRE
jgi:hypothetical protein